MYRVARLVAASAAGTLVLGGVMFAAPAWAAAKCHDSASVHHAKLKEQALIVGEEKTDTDNLASSKDQLAVDQDEQSDDLANSGSTAAQLGLDAGYVARDKKEIAAITAAKTAGWTDRTYFGRCGTGILKSGVRRLELHSDQLSLGLDQGSLLVAEAQLAWDREQYGDAEATGDTTGEDESRLAMDDDESLIQTLDGEIADLGKALKKL